jgi:hypothetical protein
MCIHPSKEDSGGELNMGGNVCDYEFQLSVVEEKVVQEISRRWSRRQEEVKRIWSSRVYEGFMRDERIRRCVGVCSLRRHLVFGYIFSCLFCADCRWWSFDLSKDGVSWFSVQGVCWWSTLSKNLYEVALQCFTARELPTQELWQILHTNICPPVQIACLNLHHVPYKNIINPLIPLDLHFTSACGFTQRYFSMSAYCNVFWVWNSIWK